MALSVIEKKEVIRKIQRSAQDTGSPETQTAILTAAINRLTEHMKQNPKDFHSRRGLLKKVSRRRRLLDYLKRENMETYLRVIEMLELRK